MKCISFTAWREMITEKRILELKEVSVCDFSLLRQYVSAW
jgi:hypothetical protein